MGTSSLNNIDTSIQRPRNRTVGMGLGIEFQKTITSWKRWQRHTQMPILRYRYTITKLS